MPGNKKDICKKCKKQCKVKVFVAVLAKFGTILNVLILQMKNSKNMKGMRILFGIAQNALFITVESAAKLLREGRKVFFVIVVINGFTISAVDWTETLLINLDVLKTRGSVWTVLKIMFPFFL